MNLFVRSGALGDFVLTLPVVDYGRGDGVSVTGGVVYRGCRMPGYAGYYFYADYGTGIIRSFRLEGGRAGESRDWTAALGGAGRVIRNPSSFGVDADVHQAVGQQDPRLSIRATGLSYEEIRLSLIVQCCRRDDIAACVLTLST